MNKKEKQKTYELDVEKIKTFEDLKVILKNMGLIFIPEDEKAFNEVKPYIKEK